MAAAAAAASLFLLLAHHHHHHHHHDGPGSISWMRTNADQGETFRCPQPGHSLVLPTTKTDLVEIFKSPIDQMCLLMMTMDQEQEDEPQEPPLQIARSLGGNDWKAIGENQEESGGFLSIRCNHVKCRLSLAHNKKRDMVEYSLFSPDIGLTTQARTPPANTPHAPALLETPTLPAAMEPARVLDTSMTVWQCPQPDPNTAATVVTDSPLARIGLELSSASDHLCALALTDGVQVWMPIARSYSGFEWEEYHLDSPFLQQDLGVDCTSQQGVCSLILPTLADQSGLFYVLQSWSETLEPQDEFARFLEQATFGTTRDDLNKLLWDTKGGSVSPKTVMAQWIQDQQQTVEPTYHREFYRRRLNDRFESSSPIGHVTHPCQAQSLYRKWTFTYRHQGQFVHIERVSPDSKWRVLSIDGVALTVVYGRLYFSDDLPENIFGDGMSHEICKALSGVGAEFQLYHAASGKCKQVKIGATDEEGKEDPFYGNPAVFFPDGVTLPPLVVSLDNSVGVVAADTEYFAQQTPPVQLIRAAQPLTDAVCDTIQLGSGAIPTVFATYQGEYWLHDPRFALNDNTLAAPMFDGGGSIVEQTQGGSDSDFTAQCSNVPRSFENEDSCFLSSSLQACDVDSAISNARGEYGKGVVVCGSPGEVSNDLRLGGEMNQGAFSLYAPFGESTSMTEFIDQRRIVWAAVALWSKDQLRQRVGWALSQIFVINKDAGLTSQPESFLHYYDILTRHAFENYRTILKKVTFSRSMGRMLSFQGSKSTGYQWTQTQDVVELPDENYSREFMQLFTIGVHLLNRNGTPKLSPEGRRIKSYTNKHIMEYARVWTGFTSSPGRGNSAASEGNYIDPMTIDRRWRDPFPKLGVNDQYIGHGYPLCRDLPAQHHLTIGATYRLLGYSSRPELLHNDPGQWMNRENIVWFEANADAATKSNSLYSVLCDAKHPGEPCRFPPVVRLDQNLECHGEMECSVRSLRQVKVGDVFYEYIHQPCVQLAFYDNPQKIKRRDWYLHKKMWMCSDPLTESAAAVCCNGGGEDSDVAEGDHLYWGELVDLQTAEDRCNAKAQEDDPNYAMCTGTGVLKWTNGHSYAYPFFWFGDVSCLLKVKFDNTGKVAVVHEVPDEDATADRKKLLTDEDTKTFFPVLWNEPAEVDSFVESCPTGAGCSYASDGHCMCNIHVTEATVFGPDEVPTPQEVASDLTVGAFHPDIFGVPYSTQTTHDGVTVYTMTSTNETIFEVVDEFGVMHRRRNVAFTVHVAGSNLTFPAPVHFMSLQEPAKRDALYETDAAIDQLFYHGNTAPFVATHMAKRFGLSNPTPRLIHVLADAFVKGRYSYDGEGDDCRTFGSGAYGDLAALTAALLLDRESRDPVVGIDPTSGQVKEPILKHLGLMRALDFKTTPEHPLPRFMTELQHAIGQNVFEAETIFGFFMPNFQPSGMVGAAGMYSPETEIHASPQLVAHADGLAALIKYGSDRCFGGFGHSINWDWNCESRVPGDFVDSSGYLSYVPMDAATAEVIVDELATLITSGRLSAEHRSDIVAVVKAETDPAYAAIKAQQLIATTSAFHTTGKATPSGEARSVSIDRTPSSKPYKAVVVIMLGGGADTYNLVVPHTCSEMNAANETVLEQYEKERGMVGLTDSERHLTIDVDGQPCEKFAIHESISTVQSLYEQGDLCFFMDTGFRSVANVTKHNFEALTEAQLFAHNWMQHELQMVDPHDEHLHTGILGRLGDVLRQPEYDFHSRTISINRRYEAVNGGDNHAPQPIVMSDRGAQQFGEKPASETFDPRALIEDMNGIYSWPPNMMAETFSDQFMNAIEETDFLAEALADVSIAQECGASELTMTAKLMETRQDRGSDRDIYFVALGGWDHHASMKTNLRAKLMDLDESIACYVENLKGAGLWDQVTTVVTSEFGRTLNPNTGDGTDHGYSGHYFGFGGALQAHKVFGKYPSDLSDQNPMNTGQGRFIPTSSWESVFQPVAEWMGVTEEEDLTKILPNRFETGTKLIKGFDMFEWQLWWEDDFDQGWGHWNDGGRDAAILPLPSDIWDDPENRFGANVARIRDDTVGKSSITSDLISRTELSGYTHMKVVFDYIPYSMEKEEDFFVELRTASSTEWTVVAQYASGVDFNNNDPIGEHFDTTAEFGLPAGDFYLRFRCDASWTKDVIYFDNVKLWVHNR